MATVHGLVEYACRRFHDRVALRDERRSVSFGELWDRTSRLASGLVRLGVQRGDRLAIVMRNRVEWVEVKLATAIAGAALTRLNARDSATDWGYIIGDVRARAVVCGSEFTDTINGLRPRLPEPVTIVSAGPGGDHDLEAIIASGSTGSPVDVSPDDRYIVFHTSGTTGRNKGVVYLHRQFVNTYRDVLAVVMGGFTEQDVFLHVGPLSHQSGMLAMPCLIRGVKQVILGEFDAETILRPVEAERVTATILAPTMLMMLMMLVEHARKKTFDLSSLRHVLYSGSPIAPEKLRQVLGVFGPVLVQGYGLMEGGGFYNTILWPRDHVVGLEGRQEILSSAGRPMPFCDVRIRREDGTEAAVGELGQIWIASDELPLEYWERPEATAEAKQYGGWLTGDMGQRDAEGYIYIVDRKNDMIVSGGLNVYPREVEDVILANPKVRLCAVVSRPDDKWGEAVTAVVQLVEGERLSLEEVQAWCLSQGLASYKKPRHLEVIDQMPLTAAGKVWRKKVRERFWAGMARRVN